MKRRNKSLEHQYAVHNTYLLNLFWHRVLCTSSSSLSSSSTCLEKLSNHKIRARIWDWVMKTVSREEINFPPGCGYGTWVHAKRGNNENWTSWAWWKHKKRWIIWNQSVIELSASCCGDSKRSKWDIFQYAIAHTNVCVRTVCAINTLYIHTHTRKEFHCKSM